jgi:hypothetical protein
VNPLATPFDQHAAKVNHVGYHNQRQNDHSDVISDGIFRDLLRACPSLQGDFEKGAVGYWRNQHIPLGRGRSTDLLVAKPMARDVLVQMNLNDIERGDLACPSKVPMDPHEVRVAVEHKSITTAHRNRSARHDDLSRLAEEARAPPRFVVAGTVMVGTALSFLNVSDRLRVQVEDEIFEEKVLPRIRAHDAELWTDFPRAVSTNKPGDSEKTIELFRTIPIRPPGNRPEPGLDALLIVPVYYDNVSEARVARDNSFGIDVDRAYHRFIEQLADCYARLYGPSK